MYTKYNIVHFAILYKNEWLQKFKICLIKQ